MKMMTNFYRSVLIEVLKIVNLKMAVSFEAMGSTDSRPMSLSKIVEMVDSKLMIFPEMKEVVELYNSWEEGVRVLSGLP